jgi:hypothetical protein
MFQNYMLQIEFRKKNGLNEYYWPKTKMITSKSNKITSSVQIEATSANAASACWLAVDTIWRAGIASFFKVVINNYALSKITDSTCVVAWNALRTGGAAWASHTVRNARLADFLVYIILIY